MVWLFMQCGTVVLQNVLSSLSMCRANQIWNKQAQIQFPEALCPNKSKTNLRLHPASRWPILPKYLLATYWYCTNEKLRTDPEQKN